MNSFLQLKGNIGFTGLSIIIPVVSETESFEETFDIITSSCNYEDIKEIIFGVSDKATVECRKTAEKLLKSEYPFDVYIYNQHGPFEQAIKETVELVKGSHFIYQPADLEENPKMLCEFIRISKKNPEAIISASRVLSEYGLKDCSFLKRVIYRPYRILLNLVYNTDMTDSTLIYNVVPSAFAKAVKLEAKSYSVLYEMLLKLVRLGTEVIEVPVTYRKRKTGKSNTDFLKEGFRYLKVFVKVRFSDIRNFIDN